MKRNLSLFLTLIMLLLSACSTAPAPAPLEAEETLSLAAASPSVWRNRVIYLAIPDRFQNGNTANDNLGAPNCFDRNSPTKFHGGDIAGMRQRLGYLQDLGVSALWLTPVYRQVGIVGTSCGYHGYWADLRDPFTTEVEPKLGTKAELQGLISDLQGRNMKFILDMVVNHAGYGAQIVSQRPTWFHSASECTNEINCALAGLPDFKQQIGAVTDYLVNESKSWASQYALDGIRMDTVKHVPDWFFRDFWIPGVLGVRNNMFLVGELLNQDSLEPYKPYVAAGFDSLFNFYLQKGFVDTFAKGQSVDILAGRTRDTLNTFGLERSLLMVNLLDNHDVPRFVNEAEWGVGSYNPDEIRRRYHMALTGLFTLPGIPQLYYGNEIAAFGANDPANRPDMPTWAWTQAGRTTGGTGFLPNPQATFGLTQRLISIRTSTPALYDGYYAELWRQNGAGNPNVFAFFRGTGSSQAITAFNNGTLTSGLLNVNVSGNSGINNTDKNAMSNGTVFDELTLSGAPAVVTMTSGNFPLQLPAKTAAVYRPRGATNNSLVTFTVTASTVLGESVFLAGDRGELGAWNVARSVSMTPSNCSGSTCTWSVTLKYLLRSSVHNFKFMKRNGSNVVWESGSNRTYTVPTTATATFSGGSFRP